MLKAVQIGAGNIGRGFLGQILHESGFETTFVDANANLVTLLNQRGEYPLRLVPPGNDVPVQNLHITHVRALSPLEDRDAVVDAIAEADYVGTSVGVAILPRIAPFLAEGINRRAQTNATPINILLCENQQHCSQIMRDLLEPQITPDAQEYFQTQVGLVETVIGRMVPIPTPTITAEDPLLVVAEPYMELPLAASMVRGAFPSLVSAKLTEVFAAYEARKLFMHNAGHAALAYIGYLRGYTYIWECAQDAEIRAVCSAALSQVSQAITRTYPNALDMDKASLQCYVDDLLTRFENKALGDTVARVAADPLRKLRPDDRLIGAVQLCLSQNLSPQAFAVIIAAALRFDRPEDPSAVKLQQMRHSEGDIAILKSLCGLQEENPFLQEILRELGQETSHSY